MSSNASLGRAVKNARAAGQAATIFDVAREAGFSAMTVSRVINRERGVRESTRAAVEAAIARLNYSPNPAARSLAGVEQVRIGLLYANPSSAYLSELLVGALAEARERRVMLMVEHCAPEDDPHDALTRMLDEGVDGVMLPAPLNSHDSLIEMLAERGIHGAAVAETRPHPWLVCARIDDKSAADALTTHLIAQGHRDIGFIKGDPRQSDAHARFAGYCAALDRAGIARDPRLVIEGAYTYHSGLVGAEALLALEPRPTAIFASNDDMAAGVLGAAHRAALDVPRDLSICGFDNTELSRSLWPPLTTVHQPIAALSRAALGALVDLAGARRAGEALAAPEVLLDYRLELRESVAALG